jgi:hypothetical protein
MKEGGCTKKTKLTTSKFFVGANATIFWTSVELDRLELDRLFFVRRRLDVAPAGVLILNLVMFFFYVQVNSLSRQKFTIHLH